MTSAGDDWMREIERRQGYDAMARDEGYGPMNTDTNKEAVEQLADELAMGCLEHQPRWSGDTHFDLGGSVREDETNQMMKEGAECLRALLAEREALKTEVEGALAIIATERAEVLKLREENARWREAAKWYDETIEKHVTHTGKPARISDINGVWHDGPAAEMAHKILRGLQDVLRAAMKGDSHD